MSFIEIVFGWPGILSSLIISLVGISTGRWYLLVVSALLILGFSVYLIGSPLLIWEILGVSMPLLHLGSLLLVYRGAKLKALLYLIPQILTTIYLGIVLR